MQAKDIKLNLELEGVGVATGIEDIGQPSLAPDHEEYLMERHKSLLLDPLPSANPADTLNWPSWKKNVNLALVSFHGMMATGITVGIVPAFEEFAIEYHTTTVKASYLATTPLLVLAIAPLVWIPLAGQFGRRPIWVLTVLCAAAFNVGNAFVNSYAAHMTMRVFVAVFISPGIALGQGVVMETFFKEERGQKMGIWALMVNSGVTLGPFIMGFVVEHKGWRWMYWIFAIINLFQFFAYLVFGPETIYSGVDMGPSGEGSSFKRQYLTLRRINPHIDIHEFLKPLYILTNGRILLATIAYAISFGFVFIMVVLEMSILYGTTFHLNPQQTGLNYLGIFVGALLGEIIGGPLSDYVVKRRARSNDGATLVPEDRLIVALGGFPLIIAGIVVFFVRIADATPKHWNITPTVGAGVAAFGMEIVSTTLITYCSDSYTGHGSAAVGVAINFTRLLWGFVGPFWYPHMIASCGLKGSAGLVSGLIVIFSILPVIFLQVRRLGARNRAASI